LNAKNAIIENQNFPPVKNPCATTTMRYNYPALQLPCATTALRYNYPALHHFTASQLRR